jgi:hypothetical protein
MNDKGRYHSLMYNFKLPKYYFMFMLELDNLNRID